MPPFSFEKLIVWQKARKLVVAVYRALEDFPGKEKYGLSSQISRAAVSITANIAEGSVRFSQKEKARFYEIAFGSAIEVLSHLIISKELGYIKEEQLATFRAQIVEITKMLSALNKGKR